MSLCAKTQNTEAEGGERSDKGAQYVVLGVRHGLYAIGPSPRSVETPIALAPRRALRAPTLSICASQSFSAIFRVFRQ